MKSNARKYIEDTEKLRTNKENLEEAIRSRESDICFKVGKHPTAKFIIEDHPEGGENCLILRFLTGGIAGEASIRALADYIYAGLGDSTITQMKQIKTQNKELQSTEDCDTIKENVKE